MILFLIFWSIGYLYTLCKLTNRNLNELVQSVVQDWSTQGVWFTIFAFSFIFLFWPISLLLLVIENWHDVNKKKD